MAEDKFLQPGEYTIKTAATAVHAPEHHIRRAINGGALSATRRTRNTMFGPVEVWVIQELELAHWARSWGGRLR
jgi:hypothetical protein